MEPGKPLIQLADVSVARAETVGAGPIVEQVNWTIRTGDFWAVGGVPGSGKTDLLATAAGLQKPLAGEHLLFGRATNTLTEEEQIEVRLRIGFVFGTGRLFPKTTVAENVALPICYHRNCSYEEAAPRVQAALKLSGLEHLANRRPRELPRTLHQKIGLARALALDPEVLLVDDPLLGVDPALARWWIEFLCQLTHGHPALGNRKITIVVAADDLRPWMEVARQFAVIKGKRWLEVGGREELKLYSDPILQELMS